MTKCVRRSQYPLAIMTGMLKAFNFNKQVGIAPSSDSNQWNLLGTVAEHHPYSTEKVVLRSMNDSSLI